MEIDIDERRADYDGATIQPIDGRLIARTRTGEKVADIPNDGNALEVMKRAAARAQFQTVMHGLPDAQAFAAIYENLLRIRLT